MIFDSVFAKTLGVEGNYSDAPTDRGGKTKFGITERVARANGYVGEMADLPIEEARRIAKSQYWDTLRLDDIAALSLPIATEMFDSGYNMGIAQPAKFLQRALNALNRNATAWPDMPVDGIIGPTSVAALRAFLAKRGADGERVMLRALNDQQGVRYIEIAERDPAQEANVFGWYLNRVS